jgi:hypothetical protein
MSEDIKIKNEPNKQDSEVKHIGNTVGGTVDAASLSRIVAEAVAEALKAAIPAAAIGIQQAQFTAAEKVREAQVREVMRKTKRCPLCGLAETACGGAWAKDKEGKDIIEYDAAGLPKYNWALNHTKEYVGPKDDNLFRWFQGVIVNGVRFLSDYPGHKILIPIKSDIMTQVSMWEQNEKDLLQKRTAHGMGMGNAGPGGVQRAQNQNFLGWR